MKRKIKNLFVKFISIFPKKYILFESAPDYSDNSWLVYEYIKKNIKDIKYTPIWFIDKRENRKRSVPTIVYNRSLWSTLKYFYYNCRSKIIVFCNRPIQKFDSSTVSICLCHGSKSKNTRGKYEMPKDLDYILIQADMFKEVSKYGYNLADTTRMITMGYPRNDDLFNRIDVNRKELFDLDYDKLIVWYPTFRQHKNGKYQSSVTLPIIDDEQIAIKINNFAKENKVLMVLKPHFAQDTSYIKKLELSNLVIIDDDFLREKEIRSYQLLSLSDALLTDYSSVYYDYLLLDKPIGLVWTDYEEYKNGQGFALDPDTIYMGGEKIFNCSDLINFISHVVSGEDLLQVERNKIKDLSNEYQDGNSSKRVAEFILNLSDR